MKPPKVSLFKWEDGSPFPFFLFFPPDTDQCLGKGYPPPRLFDVRKMRRRFSEEQKKALLRFALTKRRYLDTELKRKEKRLKSSPFFSSGGFRVNGGKNCFPLAQSRWRGSPSPTTTKKL